MGSEVVILVRAPEGDAQFVLDLLELWCCLIFQTLQKRDLEVYLPQDMTWTSCYLNIANHFWQSFERTVANPLEREQFFKNLKDVDPAIRVYYKARADTFHALKNSNDPELYGYWFAARQRTLDTSVIVSTEKTANSLRRLMGAGETCVRVDYKSNQRTQYSHFPIRIRKQTVELQSGTTIYAQ